MKIEIHTKNTTNPTALLAKIKKDIKENKLKTWSIASDQNNEEFLTHNPDQWINKALLKPSAVTNPERLIMTVTWFTALVPNEYVKGFYIGRFTEVLLEHYREYFSKLETSG